MYSRATLCEILALKLLTHFASSKIQLAAVLTTLWSPLAGAPADVIEEVKDAVGGEDECDNNPQCTIEVSSSLSFFLNKKYTVNDPSKRWQLLRSPRLSWLPRLFKALSMTCTMDV